MGNSAGPKITKDGLVLDFDAANLKSYNFYADPYASNVSLYLKMDGANGSTAFTDSSPNAFSVTATNATISTDQSKYGGASLSLSTTSSYLSLGAQSNFAFGTGDFTIEMWIQFTNSLVNRNFLDFRPSAVNGSYPAMYVNTNFKYFVSSADRIVSTTSPTLGQWYHIAVSRSSGSTRMFVNGIQEGVTYVDSTNYAVSRGPIIGNGWDLSGAGMTGYIDEIRITKGVARYTSNFTSPPIPSTFTDLTRSKNVGTLTGGVDYNFSNGGSLVFDGVNGYVNIPASTNLTFGTGDFTMEVWFKTRAKTMLYPTLLSVNLAWASNVWVLVDRHNVTAPTKFTFHVYNIASPTLTSVTAPSNGVWYNVVITRIGTLFSMYVNGVLESTATSSASLDGGVSNSINLGRQSSSDNTYYDGNIPLARIYKAKGLTSAEVYNNFVANRGRFGV